MNDRDIAVVVLVAEIETEDADDPIRGPEAEIVDEDVPDPDQKIGVGTGVGLDHVTKNVIEAVVVTKIANPRRKMMRKML